MINRVTLLAFSCLWLALIGCSKEKPEEKTTIEKLNSDDVQEQMEGLREAEEKYGRKDSR